MREARIGVVGATGAVGGVTLAILAERGYRNVRAFASARSVGRRRLAVWGYLSGEFRTSIYTSDFWRSPRYVECE